MSIEERLSHGIELLAGVSEELGLVDRGIEIVKRISTQGCSNGDCKIVPKRDRPHTNGRCSCHESVLLMAEHIFSDYEMLAISAARLSKLEASRVSKHIEEYRISKELATILGRPLTYLSYEDPQAPKVQVSDDHIDVEGLRKLGDLAYRLATVREELER